MSGRLRKQVQAATSVVLFLAMSAPSMRAECPQSRPFRSFSPIESEGILSAAADFWAYGEGDPMVGTGIDSGHLQIFHWFSGSAPNGDWNESGVDGCIDQAGASPRLDLDEHGMFAVVAKKFRPMRSSKGQLLHDGLQA